MSDTADTKTAPAFAATIPIFDRLGNVYGYELKFRAGLEAELVAAITSNGIEADLWEAMGLSDIVGFGRAHVPFPQDLILKGAPLLLPAETLAVSIAAGEGDDQAIVNACRELKDAGYELVIGGFRPEHRTSQLLRSADLVCVDTTALTAENQHELSEHLCGRGIRPIARNVDTPDQYELAREAGYSCFEGDFFRRPVLQPGKEILTSKAHHMALLQEFNKEEWDVDSAELLIEQDVSMTYRLLRFINSAWFGLKYEVSSIRHALVLLGPREVKLWASMLMLHQLGEGKPKELFRRCLIRAKMAEGLAPLVGLKPKARELFLMGMLSLVDALADVSLEEAFDGLPVSKDIRHALLAGTGPFGPIYQALTDYEMARWEAFADTAAAIGLDENAVPTLFGIARKWADNALGSM